MVHPQADTRSAALSRQPGELGHHLSTVTSALSITPNSDSKRWDVESLVPPTKHSEGHEFLVGEPEYVDVAFLSKESLGGASVRVREMTRIDVIEEVHELIQA